MALNLPYKGIYPVRKLPWLPIAFEDKYKENVFSTELLSQLYYTGYWDLLCISLETGTWLLGPWDSQLWKLCAFWDLTMRDFGFQKVFWAEQPASVSRCTFKPLLFRYVINFGLSLLPPVSFLQELIAVGLCNICSAFFRSFAVSCAISGTVIQEKTGGRTQVSWAKITMDWL